MAFLDVPDNLYKNMPEWVRKIAKRVNELNQGKSNNVGSFTLAAGAGSTVIQFAKGRVGTETFFSYFPKTAHAAADWGSGSMYESSRDVANATITLTHPNNGNADKTFDYTLIG